MPDEFVTVARAVIVIGHQLLVARGPDESFCTLPGGHVEAGEEPADALVRELREELGREVSALQKLIELDNIYDRDGTTIHERNHVFPEVGPFRDAPRCTRPARSRRRRRLSRIFACSGCRSRSWIASSSCRRP
jgi:8-oxo-dGTP pyrophosphatase MutT (NUDIX family)